MLRSAALVALCVFLCPWAWAQDTSNSLAPIHSDSGFRRGSSRAQPFSASPETQVVYHDGATLLCSDCHIMHASQSHEIDMASPGYFEEIPYLNGANPNLLKASDPVDLCLACHDGHTFAPDVVSADANGLAERSAGHFELPDEINPRGHDLGRGVPTGGGFELCMRCHFGGTDPKVTCIDCHDPHGNGVARNLQWASDPAGTPELGLFTNPGATGMARYEANNVAYGTSNSTLLREVSNMCLDCHHVFTGGTYNDPFGTGIHVLHPAYDSERGDPNSIAQGDLEGTSDPAHWEAGTGSGFITTSRVRFVVSGATDYATAQIVDAETNGVFCLSCHKAHGSNQAFGLTWQLDGGYSAPGCDQCHAIANVGSP